MFLVDTCVLSEARRENSDAVGWLKLIDPESVYLSVITIGEIMIGIALKGRTDAHAAAALRQWLSRLQRLYADRILPIDTAVALEWGNLSAARTRPMADALIAATARVHRKIVVTRNLADFSDAGVEVLNPWS
jgi:predicted nucleic acid-binding protein